MDKRFFVAWAVVFVVWVAGSFVVHGVLLGADYATLPNLFRPESDAPKYFPLMILAHIIMSGAFVWIYRQGREDKPTVAQGLRFGIAVALMTVVPTYMIYYVVQPMPGAMVVKQIVYDSVLLLILGVVAALLMQPKAA